MSKIIESIEYFPAGYCSSNAGLLFKGMKLRKMQFPAGVFLLKHRDYGYILYDTGYHYAIKTQWRYALYRLGTPVQMHTSDQIQSLLAARGMDPSEIAYVLLSHLHPDHIGGARFFPQAQFIVTQDVWSVYQHPRLKDLIFKAFLPDDFQETVQVIRPERVNPAFPYRPTYDLFGDGSLLVASVDGHAKGQACLYVTEQELLIAADLCWGIDLLPHTSRMRRLPAWVQDDQQAYLQGVALLEQLLADGRQVVVSHDPVERIERILDETIHLP